MIPGLLDKLDGPTTLVLVVGARTIYELAHALVKRSMNGNGNGSDPMHKLRGDINTATLKVAVLEKCVENIEETCKRIENNLNGIINMRCQAHRRDS